MQKQKILGDLYNAILSLDTEKAKQVAEEIVKSDIDVSEAVEKGMSPAMEEMGEKFQLGEAFLPELQISADAFESAMNIFHPKLVEAKKQLKPKGRILMGTVKGDVHNVGKNLVSTMLKTAGFEVIDLGIDVDALKFLEEAERNEVDMIGLSSLLTTTMLQQREVIDVLNSQGVREKYRVIVGGAPVTQEWADEIKADGYGENATQAVKLAKSLCTSKCVHGFLYS